MPGLSGWDVLSRLKADPQIKNIPVVIVTIVDDEAVGIDKGASSYLVKPIDRDRLAVALEKYRTKPPVGEQEGELVHSGRN
jgi:CheY-like chemotaxis protein